MPFAAWSRSHTPRKWASLTYVCLTQSVFGACLLAMALPARAHDGEETSSPQQIALGIAAFLLLLAWLFVSIHFATKRPRRKHRYLPRRMKIRRKD